MATTSDTERYNVAPRVCISQGGNNGGANTGASTPAKAEARVESGHTVTALDMSTHPCTVHTVICCTDSSPLHEYAS